MHTFIQDRLEKLVNLAAQIFSNSVASGMSTTLKSGILPPSAQYTIDFISNMEKLFDIFNSYKTPNLEEFNRPFKNIESQINHLNKMAEVFRNMKVVNKFNGSNITNKMNFINGWLITISSLKMLWYSLNPTKNPNYVLYTRFRATSVKKFLILKDQIKIFLNLNVLASVCADYAYYQKELNQSFLLSFYKAYPTGEHSTFGNLMMPDDDFYNFKIDHSETFVSTHDIEKFHENMITWLLFVLIVKQINYYSMMNMFYLYPKNVIYAEGTVLSLCSDQPRPDLQRPRITVLPSLPD
ncbi:hypothetical protein QTP88_024109 [Uroleucon formosanum]